MKIETTFLYLVRTSLAKFSPLTFPIFPPSLSLSPSSLSFIVKYSPLLGMQCVCRACACVPIVRARAHFFARFMSAGWVRKREKERREKIREREIEKGEGRKCYQVRFFPWAKSHAHVLSLSFISVVVCLLTP